VAKLESTMVNGVADLPTPLVVTAIAIGDRAPLCSVYLPPAILYLDFNLSTLIDFQFTLSTMEEETITFKNTSPNFVIELMFKLVL
jgi:hypothetical protein